MTHLYKKNHLLHYLILFCVLFLASGCSSNKQSVALLGYPALPPKEYYERAKAIMYQNGQTPPLNSSISVSDLELSVKLLTYYLKTFDTDATAINLRAMAYKLLSQNKDAISDFKQAIKIDPSNDAYPFNLANFYFDSRSYKEALSLYSDLIKRNPVSSEYHVCLAKTYESMNSHDLAFEEYKIAYEYDHTNQFAKNKLFNYKISLLISEYIGNHRSDLNECFSKKQKSDNPSDYTLHVAYDDHMEYQFTLTPVDQNIPSKETVHCITEWLKDLPLPTEANVNISTDIVLSSK